MDRVYYAFVLPILILALLGPRTVESLLLLLILSLLVGAVLGVLRVHRPRLMATLTEPLESDSKLATLYVIDAASTWVLVGVVSGESNAFLAKSIVAGPLFALAVVALVKVGEWSQDV